MNVEPNTILSPLASARKTLQDTTSGEDRTGIVDKLENFAESAAQSRKVFAEERLKHLKEQMNKLVLFDMAPGAMVGQSAQLAKELNSAASDFASAFEALSGTRQPTAEGLSLAQQAYLGLDYSDDMTHSPLDQADLETASSFVTAARQIASMAERARSKSDTTDGLTQLATGTREAAFGVIEMMSRLTSAPARQSFSW